MVIKLNVKAFNDAARANRWTDAELAKEMGISTTQLWRVRLPEEDPRHNDPGKDFIAGTLKAFPEKKFDDLFFLALPLRSRNNEQSTTTGTGAA